MKITSTRSDMSAAATLVLCVFVVLPAVSRADIYKWTDGQGRTVFSNIAPAPSDKVKKVEVVLKEDPLSAPAQAHVATPTEQALLGRIESLERPLQTRPSLPPAAMAPPAIPYGANYAPEPGYYPDAYDYPPYYPNYYYPAPYYATSFFPARVFVKRPVFVGTRSGSFHRGGGHRGRR